MSRIAGIYPIQEVSALTLMPAPLTNADEAIKAYEHALKLGLTAASTNDEQFIATHLTAPHRVGHNHVSIHAALVPLYERVGRLQDAAISANLYQLSQP